MLRPSLFFCESSTFQSLGRLPTRSRPLYFQQQHNGSKVMDRQALRDVTNAPRHRAAMSMAMKKTALTQEDSVQHLAHRPVDQPTPQPLNASSSASASVSLTAHTAASSLKLPRHAAARAERLVARLRGEEGAADHPHKSGHWPALTTPSGDGDSDGALAPLPRRAPKRHTKQRPFRFADDADDWASQAADGVELLHQAAEDDVLLDTPASLWKTIAAAETASLAPTTAEAPGEDSSRPLSFAEEVQQAKAKHALRDQLPSLDADQPSLRPDDDDDDDEVVMDSYVEARVAEHQHPAARGIAQDVIDLVTDAFTKTREKEIERRRKALYELTHPNPSEYTYGAKLVPPPPLNFGKITDEAKALGEELMLAPQFSLVNQAGVKAEPHRGEPLDSGALADGMIEVSLATKNTRRQKARGAAAATQNVIAPHRSRKREDNIFRDHNYFFEINEMYQEIVLVGKASAGKSSLINALLGQPDLAKTSSTPHTTRKINFYQSVSPEELHRFHEQQHHQQLVKLPGGGLQLTFVDMPGYGIEGMSDAWRDAAIELTDAYFGVRRSVNTVLFCVDCERGLTKTDVKYFKWIENVQGVFYVVLTKCDSVPHSRICSVMRQIYVLITKNRKKFRKVFPYVIPVSARDGTNVDLLRGLITETSGMIPGDRLRDLLKTQKAATMEASVAQEALRLAQVRTLERTQAREQFLEAYKDKLPANSPLLLPPRSEAAGEPLGHSRKTTAAEASRERALDADVASAHAVGAPCGKRVFELDLVGRTVREGPLDAAIGDSPASSPEEGDEGDALQGEAAARRQRRERFLAWRKVNPLDKLTTPYGDLRYRLNTGLDNPLGDAVRLEYADDVAGRDGDAPLDTTTPSMENRTVAAANQPPPSATALSGASQSRVIGLDSAAASPPFSTSPASTAPSRSGGPVSHFCDVLDQFANQTREEKPSRLKKRQRHGVSRPRFLVEDGCGRLVGSQGGRPVGPSLVSADTDLNKRQAAWKAQQLRGLLWKENAEAPWEAMQSLTKKLERNRQQVLMSGMRRKEQEAYLKNAGKVTESFEKFESEVTTAKYMNEVRRAKTVRSQQQMHLNATAKINYRSMPTGLWKQYGRQQEGYWPTPRVLGRENDESHEDSGRQSHAVPYARKREHRKRREKATHSPSSSHHRSGGKRLALNAGEVAHE